MKTFLVLAAGVSLTSAMTTEDKRMKLIHRALALATVAASPAVDVRRFDPSRQEFCKEDGLRCRRSATPRSPECWTSTACSVPAGRFALAPERWGLRDGTAAPEAVRRHWPMNTSGGCERVVAGETPRILARRASSSVRFVFVVGLERSGHHYVGAVLRRLNETGARVAPAPKDVLEHLSGGSGRRGLFAAYGRRTPGAAGDAARAFAAGVVRAAAAAAPGTTFALNAMADHHGIGELSYPNYRGHCKPMSVPDVRLLGEIFEAAGLEFRVLVLRRPAIDELHSATVRHAPDRPAEAYGQLFSYVLDDHILRSQLRRLSPSFSRCVDASQLPRAALDRATRAVLQWSFNSRVFGDRMCQNEAPPFSRS